MTTFYCIDYLDEALWVPGMSTAILAHEQKYNSKIFSIVKRAFENLPADLKPKTKTDTKYAYEFVEMYNGVKLDSSIYVDTDVRSGTVLKLHITEAAWLKDPARIDAGAKQAVPKNGSITEETTANGFNDFYDKYNQSEQLESMGQSSDYDYKTYFYAWWENPEYSLPGEMPEITIDDQIKYGDENKERELYHLTDGQLLWRRWKINELRQSKKDAGITLNGLQLFRQEYPASRLEAFQSGAGNVFDVTGRAGKTPLTLDQCIAALKGADFELFDTGTQSLIEAQIVIITALYKLGTKFWEVPKRGKSYVIGVDPSDGKGSDYSDVDVWDEDSLEQVAQLYIKDRPDIVAEHTVKLANFYNRAFVGVENNMLTCALEVSKLYDNYFFTTVIDEKTLKKTKKIGFTTSTKTRDPMIDGFVADWEDADITVNSVLTLSEMKTFVTKDNGKREHADGKHDDSLFGAMIALEIRKRKPKGARVFSSKPF